MCTNVLPNTSTPTTVAPSFCGKHLSCIQTASSSQYRMEQCSVGRLGKVKVQLGCCILAKLQRFGWHMQAEQPEGRFSSRDGHRQQFGQKPVPPSGWGLYVSSWCWTWICRSHSDVDSQGTLVILYHTKVNLRRFLTLLSVGHDKPKKAVILNTIYLSF